MSSQTEVCRSFGRRPMAAAIGERRRCENSSTALRRDAFAEAFSHLPQTLQLFTEVPFVALVTDQQDGQIIIKFPQCRDLEISPCQCPRFRRRQHRQSKLSGWLLALA